MTCSVNRVTDQCPPVKLGTVKSTAEALKMIRSYAHRLHTDSPDNTRVCHSDDSSAVYYTNPDAWILYYFSPPTNPPTKGRIRLQPDPAEREPKMSQLYPEQPENLFHYTALALGGGRHLTSPAAAAFIKNWIKTAAATTPITLNVGCAIGADEAVITAALEIGTIPTTVFSIFSSTGAGCWRDSATKTILAAASANPPNFTFCWSVGDASKPLPLSARLARRSACVNVASNLAVWFAPGHGSLAAAATSIRTNPGRPVIAVCNIAPPLLIAVPDGRWIQISMCASPAWLWTTNRTQSKLI